MLVSEVLERAYPNVFLIDRIENTLGLFLPAAAEKSGGLC